MKQHDPETIMVTIKDFDTKVIIDDKVASKEVKKLINEISLMITFHKKF